MATTLSPLLRSSGSSFLAQFRAFRLQPSRSLFTHEKIVPSLIEQFSYTNIHQVPKVDKIVVKSGIAQNENGLEAAIHDLTLITGQRPVKTRVRYSVATFKNREAQPLGIAVTLRGKMMYSFLDRLVYLGLPRTGYFQGLNPNSFDGNGNFKIGIEDQTVFPELISCIGTARGMDICISTTAKTYQEGQRLLALMGMPFREEGIEPMANICKKKLKSPHFDPKSKRRARK